MELLTVDNKKTRKAFHKVPRLIYKDDPYWIPHIESEVEAIFDPRQNAKYHRNGSVQRWVLKGDRGQLLGRVAVFYYEKQKWGGMGFFECINDQDAAFMLFDRCKEWLEDRGATQMDGPVNFGERNKYWGLITENFQLSPYYGQNYNPSYYVDLFEAYGFKVYFEQFIYYRDIMVPTQQHYIERYQRILSHPNYTVQAMDKKNAMKYAEDFRTVYNRAWGSQRKGFTEMPSRQARHIMKQLLPVMDDDMIIFAYYGDRPIGFFITLPELNEIFRYVDGKLNWWGKLKFLYHQKRGACNTIFGMVFGIDPEFQSKGVEGAIFHRFGQQAWRKPRRYRYTDLLITWIGDFNPKMIRLVEQLEATRIRTMATYRLLFDPNEEFKRHPKLS